MRREVGGQCTKEHRHPSSCWRFLGVFCECLVCVCLLSCFRSTPQAGEAAGSRDATATGRCGTGGIFSMVNDGGHGVANLSSYGAVDTGDAIALQPEINPRFRDRDLEGWTGMPSHLAWGKGLHATAASFARL